MNRTQELLSAVDQYCHVHDTWASDGNSPVPTLEYWYAYDELIRTFQVGDIPAECRPLAESVWKLAEQKIGFDVSGDAYPGDKFWAAREEVAVNRRKLSYNNRPMRESIAELHRQNVPHGQICQIWGLMDEQGRAQLHLVEQELGKPGSVITAEYIHPDDRTQAQREAAARERLESVQSAAKVDEPTPIKCPESSRELWLQKVPLPQAARMLGKTTAQVQREWEKFDSDFQRSVKEGEFYELSDDEVARQAQAAARRLGTNIRGRNTRESRIAIIRECEQRLGKSARQVEAENSATDDDLAASSEEPPQTVEEFEPDEATV